MDELLTTQQMAAADRLTIAEGTPGMILMERAGAAIAACMLANLRRDSPMRVLVLCGPGNNGGDGFVAAAELRNAGHEVRLALLGNADRLRGDAAIAAARWSGSILDAGRVEIEADLVVDALFGAGLARDLEGDTARLIERVNAWRARTRGLVIAVDVPSGIDGNTGAVRGVAIEADRTITFFRRKPGHLLLPGRVNCGDVTIADIGISDAVLAVIAPTVAANIPALWRTVLPIPRVDGHKYSRGNALVVSGGAETTGAARLAARGALRAGAGLVTVATPSDALGINAAALTAIMTRVADGPDGLAHLLADPRKNAIVMGPGLGIGAATRALVEVALRPGTGERAVVLDADALTSFAGRHDELFRLIRAARGPVVLTPHAGEFVRLFGEIGASKLDASLAASARASAIVVLKGADTVVAAPDGAACIADNAPPWLATAGAGDVLAGMIGGLLAQAMPAFAAASAAVWMHGDAAARFGPGLIAEDLPEALPHVWRALMRLREAPASPP